MRHLSFVTGPILALALGVAAAADPAHYDLRANIDPAVDAGKDASFETAKVDKPFAGLQAVTIGRPAFDRILGELGRNPPRVTADFLAVVTKVAGADAARAFETALRRDGYG